jgi:xanthine dehydrogenase YagR molybdenum-binding subunit
MSKDQELQPVAPVGTGYVEKGQPLPRIDGRGKVTGSARYSAEYGTPGLLHGAVVNSTIARGRIAALHVDAALAVPGVHSVLSHANRPPIASLDKPYQDQVAPGGPPFKPFADDQVRYSGQPVALVVAESWEAARYAASLVRLEYERAPHETSLLPRLAQAHDPDQGDFEPPPGPKGDPDQAFAAAPVRVDVEFHAGYEHHNPMEMHATTVHYEAGGRLTIYDKSQSSQNCQQVVVDVFGLDPQQVTVKNLFVGGAFGSGLRPAYNLHLAVMAALFLQRSVRVMLTRQQMFTFGHRPETWQRVRLGAERDGTLKAIIHECKAETSRFEDFTEVVVNWSAQLYRTDTLRLGYQLVDLDHYTPQDMRAPGATHGVHAIEVAMDEMACALGMDPLALRLQNYAEVEPTEGKPFSSKELRACYEQGAQRFGWSRRPLAPRSMRAGTELVGWGMATGQWEAMQMEAPAHAVLTADGKLVVETAASDIGTGSYTVFTQIAAATLGLRMEDVTFRLGDSSLPKAPVEGGSSHVATVGSATEAVCQALQRKIVQVARQRPNSPLSGVALEDVEFVRGTVRRQGDAASALAITEVLRDAGLPQIEADFALQPDPAQDKHVCAVHSAVFVEVRVDEDFGSVRVTRMVTAVAAGRIMNALTARSQVLGGMVWGIGHALHEETHADHALGRFMTHNYADYHIPVQADVHALEAIFVQEDDRIVSQLGAKGVGEIGIVGVAAAISNAIYHATGRRIRSTPMTPDKVMAPGDGWSAGDSGVGINREHEGVPRQLEP